MQLESTTHNPYSTIVNVVTPLRITPWRPSDFPGTLLRWHMHSDERQPLNWPILRQKFSQLRKKCKENDYDNDVRRRQRGGAEQVPEKLAQSRVSATDIVFCTYTRTRKLAGGVSFSVGIRKFRDYSFPIHHCVVSTSSDVYEVVNSVNICLICEICAEYFVADCEFVREISVFFFAIQYTNIKKNDACT